MKQVSLELADLGHKEIKMDPIVDSLPMDEKLHRTIPVVLLPYNIPMPSYDLAEVTPGVEYTLTVLGQPLSILDTDADPENDGEYHFSTVIQAFIASIVQ